MARHRRIVFTKRRIDIMLYMLVFLESYIDSEGIGTRYTHKELIDALDTMYRFLWRKKKDKHVEEWL